jgi:hypothetical protein
LMISLGRKLYISKKNYFQIYNNLTNIKNIEMLYYNNFHF